MCRRSWTGTEIEEVSGPGTGLPGGGGRGQEGVTSFEVGSQNPSACGGRNDGPQLFTPPHIHTPAVASRGGRFSMLRNFGLSWATCFGQGTGCPSGDPEVGGNYGREAEPTRVRFHWGELGTELAMQTCDDKWQTVVLCRVPRVSVPQQGQAPANAPARGGRDGVGVGVGGTNSAGHRGARSQPSSVSTEGDLGNSVVKLMKSRAGPSGHPGHTHTLRNMTARLQSHQVPRRWLPPCKGGSPMLQESERRHPEDFVRQDGMTIIGGRRQPMTMGLLQGPGDHLVGGPWRDTQCGPLLMGFEAPGCLRVLGSASVFLCSEPRQRPQQVGLKAGGVPTPARVKQSTGPCGQVHLERHSACTLPGFCNPCLVPTPECPDLTMEGQQGGRGDDR